MSIKSLITSIIIMLLLPAAAIAGEFTIVIDPGHGGKDAGALGQRTNEKSINLAVGSRLRDLIAKHMPDAKVLMTRDNDYFVTLQGRADFANRRHADIFISIHANSVDKKSPMFTKVNGASVYTLGLQRSDTNLSVAMRENAVMKLEPDYSTTYQGFDPSSAESYIAFEMMQHSHLDQSIELAQAVQDQLVRSAGRKNNGVRQAPFWVLVRTSMPAILVELDFICNPTMEKYMASSAGQDQLAKAIYNGIAKYRKKTPLKVESGTATVISQQSDATEASSGPKKETINATDTQAKEKTKPGSATQPDKSAAQPEKSAANNSGNSSADNRKDSGTPAMEAASGGEIIYKIQFLTSPYPLKEGDPKLKGVTPVENYRDGNTVKYTYGAYKSISEASGDLRKVRQKFADAFVIKTCDGRRIK